MQLVKPMTIAEVMEFFRFDENVDFVDEHNDNFQVLYYGELKNQDRWNNYQVCEIVDYASSYELVGNEI